MDPIPTASLPDYDRIGANFDRWLPLIEPVTLAILERLPVPADGSTVLDVACGTGEPGLTLARRDPRVQLLGVDAAPGMIAAARAKAAREDLPNVRFEIMPAETIALPDASADAVISRFGLLLFGDLKASARELARVLRPGGCFSLAVWETVATNTLSGSVYLASRDHLPPELVPPFERLDAFAAEGLRTGLLRDAGLRVVETEMFTWTMEFESFDVLWELISGPGVFERQFATLDAPAREAVRHRVSELLAPHRDEAGAYHLPHSCRLIWGQR
jgi:ubiquinone/menaquinone biosynthesis C-methylase UbiE